VRITVVPVRHEGRLKQGIVALMLVGLVAVSLAAPSAAQPVTIGPDNRPTPLPGRENGRIPDADLIWVAPGCRVAREAAASLHLLLQAAAGRGVGIGTRSCYRPVEDQVRVRQQWTARGNSACAAAVRTDPSGRVIGTSIHGWGKAVDFTDRGGPMTFTSPGFGFLAHHAARYGWNHPGWARPGGGPCPEPWHWEWVGDGGRLGGAPVVRDVVAGMAIVDGRGWWTVTGLGEVTPHGTARDQGSAAAMALAWVVVGASPSPSGAGYWLVAADGGVFGFGDAGFFGSTGGMRLNRPVVGMAATPSGAGYWLVAADGGVFGFGDAGFFGSTGGMRLNRPVVGMAATPSGAGYWLVAADGGVFGFGDARFFGSTGAIRLAEPVVAMAPTLSGDGYWLAAADGGVFAFGDARYFGSAAGAPGGAPTVGIVATRTGGGYWLIAADGTVSAYGDATGA
jgi:hypothetical protein